MEIQLVKNTNLDAIKRKFKQWRSQRHNSAEPIPEKLWSMAISLYPKYKRSNICQQLGLSGGQLKKHLEQVEKNNSTKTGFVLATANSKEVITSAPSNVQISISGTRTVTISVGVHDACHIIPYIGSLL